jgi:hypothetical protein
LGSSDFTLYRNYFIIKLTGTHRLTESAMVVVVVVVAAAAVVVVVVV